ncbi:MAG: histidine kinase dimerization/phospho-acceptor domain-containing protein [Pseudomonadota bacterium]
MSTDATERIARERRLSQLNESLRDFTHIAAHDLQAPLRQVAVLTEILEEELGQNAEQVSEDVQDVVRGISTGVRRMRGLVSSLHQLSKLESIAIERQLCDLQKVVVEGRALASLALDETNAKVVVDSLPSVHGSAELLAQLFQNLFSNACKYAGDSPPKVRIWSEVKHERGWIWSTSKSAEWVYRSRATNGCSSPFIGFITGKTSRAPVSACLSAAVSYKPTMVS